MNNLNKIKDEVIKYSSKFDIEEKRSILTFLVFLISSIFVVDAHIFPLPYIAKVSVYTILIILIIFFSVDKVKHNKLSRRELITIVAPLIIIGIGALITGIVANVKGYLAFSIIYAVILPSFALIKENINTEFLLDVTTKTILVFYLVLSILNIIFMPIGLGQYPGIVYDPNTLSTINMVGISSTLYVLNKQKKMDFKIFAALSFAITFTLMSKSRTGILGLLALLITQILMYKNFKLNIKKVLTVFLAFIVTYFSLLMVYQFVTPSLSEKIYPILGRNYSKNYERIVKGIKENKIDILQEGTTDVIKRHLKGIADEDNISSGRSLLWKEFMSKVTFIGHKVETLDVGYWGIRMLAHNAFIQTWFSFGFVSFIGFILLALSSIIYSLKQLIKFTKITPDELFSIHIIGTYILFSLVFSYYHIYSSLLSLFFILVMILKIDNRNNKSLK